ncbi:hypothetical protein EYF80_015428 [Liparis tanakae]|uniref:Uncharacterized protein n=1 Tax=Liparis tanakae TaxID=230148 RepID=A0A4Z2IAB6_9TELE|nr:hypothetical protein EYF80_015428 [Liparis tanakae]
MHDSSKNYSRKQLVSVHCTLSSSQGAQIREEILGSFECGPWLQRNKTSDIQVAQDECQRTGVRRGDKNKFKRKSDWIVGCWNGFTTSYKSGAPE